MTETQRGQILDELKWRGALNQLTDEAGLRKLTEERRLAYTVVPTQLAILCMSAI